MNIGDIGIIGQDALLAAVFFYKYYQFMVHNGEGSRGSYRRNLQFTLF